MIVKYFETNHSLQIFTPCMNCFGLNEKKLEMLPILQKMSLLERFKHSFNRMKVIENGSINRKMMINEFRL